MTTKAKNSAIILIVDDNPVNLETLFQYFAHSEFTTLAAQDGESALLQIEHTQPDLILLDILMPRIDGFETCRRLKANEVTQDIPVIFMTALSDTVNKVKGFEVGAEIPHDCFLSQKDLTCLLSMVKTQAFPL
jgi:CheY-like chemotaxis protein